MVAIETDSAPTTAAGIAAALDEHRQAIAGIRADRDEYSARCDSEIAEHQAKAAGLIERMQAMFRDLQPATAPGRTRRRGAGAAAGTVRPNIAARQRNAAIRRYAKEHDLE